MKTCKICENEEKSNNGTLCCLCNRVYQYYITYLEEEWAQGFKPNLYRFLYDLRITDTFGVERLIRILLHLQRHKFLTIVHEGFKLFRITRYRKTYPDELANDIAHVVNICESCGQLLYRNESFAFCPICRYQLRLKERRKN